MPRREACGFIAMNKFFMKKIIVFKNLLYITKKFFRLSDLSGVAQ
tara:strand:+ start:21 stop:155 length:135 start_codon:yes stop_codon:yes gene_type:complete